MWWEKEKMLVTTPPLPPPTPMFSALPETNSICSVRFSLFSTNALQILTSLKFFLLAKDLTVLLPNKWIWQFSNAKCIFSLIFEAEFGHILVFVSKLHG